MLYAFTGYIFCDGSVLSASGDLVDLIDIDDASFSLFDVVVCRLDQLQQYIFDIFADITGFCQCRGISDRERNTQNLSQGPRDVGLAGSCGADHQNIALLNFDIRIAASVDSLVVVVNSHSECPFGSALSDHILIKEFNKLTGLFHIFCLNKAALLFLLIRLPEADKNIIGCLDAVLADDSAAASDETLICR